MTRKVVQNTRPSFHFLGQSGHETTFRVAGVSLRVCESASPQSTEYIRLFTNEESYQGKNNSEVSVFGTYRPRPLISLNVKCMLPVQGAVVQGATIMYM